MPEKTLVLAVTGGVASYKTCDLVRILTKEGREVRVVMTKNATRFVRPLVFEALTGRPVLTSEWKGGMPHIDLKREAGMFAVVPATANIIGKMAAGIADDLVTGAYLALESGTPVLVAPSMNPDMYAHPAVRRNLEKLRRDGVRVVEPADGEAVCGDTGPGKMADIGLVAGEILRLVNGPAP